MLHIARNTTLPIKRLFLFTHVFQITVAPRAPVDALHPGLIPAILHEDTASPNMIDVLGAIQPLAAAALECNVCTVLVLLADAVVLWLSSIQRDNNG